MYNPVIFVGAGPGDPDLITIAGQKALANADVIIYAGSLVNPELLSHSSNEAEKIDSAPLNLEEIFDLIYNAYKKGLKVVRLHTGDPSIYGAIYEQINLLHTHNIPYKVLPGVTSALAGAAALGLEYTLPEITQTFIITRAAGRTPVPENEELEKLASHRASMAIYLSATQGEKVGKTLAEAYGSDAPVALLYRVTWEDEKIIWTTASDLNKTLKEEKLDRHTLILVGPALKTLKNGLKAPQSKLYDASFSHGCRKGIKNG